MTPLSRTTSGFTLLELVLVLVVLAAMFAAVAPTLSGFARGRKVEDTARQFVALTKWARCQAVSDGAVYELLINPSAGTWSLRVEDGDTFSEVASPLGRVYSTPEEVRIETDIPVVNGQQAILFDPSGRSDVASIRFVGVNSVIEVSCDAPIDEFHVISNPEVR
jgi:type II secretion system protein H